MKGSLKRDAVAPLLRGRFGRDQYLYLARTPSTQRLFADSAPEGAVAVADEQTEGRGRLGRSWHAPAGTSLLFSVLLRPAVPTPRLPELTVVAALAVGDAIAAATGVAVTLKHPNDLLIDGRKVAGILAEAGDGRVVLGIGINVNQTEEQLPGEARLPPASLLLASGAEVDRGRLLAEILARLEQRYEAWLREG